MVLPLAFACCAALLAASGPTGAGWLADGVLAAAWNRRGRSPLRRAA